MSLLISCSLLDEIKTNNNNNESVDLGEEIKGNKEDFLAQINSANVLKDGISKIDISLNLYNVEKPISTQAQIIIEKQESQISRYYVNYPSEKINAYSDMNYVYTEFEGDKLRMDKNALNMPTFIEEIEEPYHIENIDSIKAYKKDGERNYVVTYIENYINSELEVLFDELPGATLTNIISTFTISNSNMVETLEFTLQYKKKNYEISASRKVEPEISYSFPNFSQYNETYSFTSACDEIQSAINHALVRQSYSKTLYEDGEQTFSYSVNKNYGEFEAIAQYKDIDTRYYKNGKIYETLSEKYSENYYPCYKPIEYNDFYSYALEEVNCVALMDFDLRLRENHFAFVLKKEDSNRTVYKCILTESGSNQVENVIGIYNFSRGVVTYTIEGDEIVNITIMAIVSGKSYTLTINSLSTLNFPDFSSYRMLYDESNLLTDVKATVRPGYDLNKNVLVDYQTGEIFFESSDNKIYRLDKNHNILDAYDLSFNYGYNYFGGFLGHNFGYVYYTIYNGSNYYKVYQIDLTTGETFLIDESSYDYYPIAVFAGTIYYQHNDGKIMVQTSSFSPATYLTIEGVSSVEFKHYDMINNVFILNGYDSNDNYFLGTYNYLNNTFTKEYDAPNLSDEIYGLEIMNGDGFFNNNIFRWYSSIGKAVESPEYLKVLVKDPDRYFTVEEYDWQIVKETEKYIFTTYGVYEKTTGNILYFPEKTTYLLFNGGLHVYGFENVYEPEKTLFTFYF